MARRLTHYHQARMRELADPESKLSSMQDPDRDPYVKVRAQCETGAANPAADQAPVAKAKKAKKGAA